MIKAIFALISEFTYIEQKGGIFDFNATLPLVILNFLVLMLIMNSLFYKPVTTILDERSNYIRNTLTTASNYLLKAEELTLKYEKALSQSRQKAQDKIRQSKNDAQKIVSINIEKAQKEASNLIETTYQQINLQKAQVLQVLKSQVDMLSNQIKAKLMRLPLS